MNIINLIKFSLDGIGRKFLKTIVLIILFTFSMILIATAILPYRLVNYSYASVNKVLSRGIENTGTIVINKIISVELLAEFEKKLYENEKIGAVGGNRIGEIKKGSVKELYDIQNNNLEAAYKDMFINAGTMNGFGVIEMDYYVVAAYNFELQKGEFEDIKMIDSTEYNHIGYMYLGSSFADIPIGTEYKVNDRYTLKVKGILKKNAKCVPETITSIEFGDIASVNMDNMAIIVDDSAMYFNHWYFNVEDGCDIEEVVEEVRSIASEMGISASVGTLEGLFEEKNRFRNQINDILLELMSVIITIAIIIQTCVLVVDILGYFHQYGVLYAVGATQKDVSLIIIIESIIRLVVSASAALGAGVLVIKIVYGDPIVQEIARNIFTSEVVWWMLLSGIVMTAVSTIVPLIMIRLNKPVKLINKQE